MQTDIFFCVFDLSKQLEWSTEEVVRTSSWVLDLQFGGPEFKSHPDRNLDLLTVVLSLTPWEHL